MEACESGQGLTAIDDSPLEKKFQNRGSNSDMTFLDVIFRLTYRQTRLFTDSTTETFHVQGAFEQKEFFSLNVYAAPSWG